MSLCREVFVDPAIRVEEAAISDAITDASLLLPEEQSAIARAVVKRQKEYIAGRVLARRACEALGRGNLPIIQGPDRAPIWPTGLVGSITHTHAYCAVAVAKSEDYVGLGIDIEKDEPLKEELWSRILTDGELGALSARPRAEQGLWAKQVFCAKEAAYKAQHAVSRTFLGFEAMSITVGRAPDSFVATLNQAVGTFFAPATVFHGRFHRAAGLLAAGVALRR